MPRPWERKVTLGEYLGKISRYSSKHAKIVLFATIIVAILLGYGIRFIYFENNLVDILPEDDPHRQSGLRLTEKFPTLWAYNVLYVEVDPSKGYDNITDPDCIRGLEEIFGFIKERVPAAQGAVGLPYYMKLVNYSRSYDIEGESNPDAFKLPSDDDLFDAEYWILENFAVNSIEFSASRDYKGGVLSMLFDPTTTNQTPAEVGAELIKAVQEYREWAPLHAKYDLFNLSRLSLTGVTALEAHTNEVTSGRAKILIPILIIFIIACLWFVFRGFRSVFISFSSFIMGIICSYGIMGYLGIPLNVFNLAIIPLLIGIGINFSIHIINEFLSLKSEGKSDEEAFQINGKRVYLALFIATLTTIAGLLTLAVSPSILMSTLGVLASTAMALLFLLSITFIPAMITLIGISPQKGVFRPAKGLSKLARVLSNYKVMVVVLLFIVSPILLINSKNVQYEVFGNPASNFQKGDFMRDSWDIYASSIGGGSYNSLTIEGDLTNPETMEYLKVLEEKVRNTSSVPERVMSIIFPIENYLMMREGLVGAMESMGNVTLPSTREELIQCLDEMYADPCWRTVLQFFIDPEYDMMILMYPSEMEDFQQVEESWDKLWNAVDEAEEIYPRPQNVEIYTFGYMPATYLFIKEQMPWVIFVGIVSFLACLIIVSIIIRRPKAILAILIPMALTTFIWLGILPFLNIGLSITLMLPLCFIMCIGSDYAIHLAINSERSGDLPLVFGITGKGILFSSLTDFGSFVIFGFIGYAMVSRAFISTALAILVIFVMTLLIIPLIYGKKE